MTDVMTLRIGKELLHELDYLSESEDKDRSEIVRELIRTGIRERKLESALQQYKDGKITLWKAARLADISLWKMTEILAQRHIDLQYGLDELRKDLKSLKE